MDITRCSKCRRLNQNFLKLKKIYPYYYNSPIKPFGSNKSKICIVGLAPGLHGANRTGIPFDGDFAGLFLKNTLKNSKYNNYNIYITNALKCYPPNNQPLNIELKNCQNYLKDELYNLKNLRVILSLGLIAHNSILDTLDLPRNSYKFKHGYLHEISNNLYLINSYHCSKININTGRLTKKMFSHVVKKSLKIACS